MQPGRIVRRHNFSRIAVTQTFFILQLSDLTNPDWRLEGFTYNSCRGYNLFCSIYCNWRRHGVYTTFACSRKHARGVLLSLTQVKFRRGGGVGVDAVQAVGVCGDDGDSGHVTNLGQREGTGVVTRMLRCMYGRSETTAYHAPSSPVKSNFWPRKPVMCGPPSWGAGIEGWSHGGHDTFLQLASPFKYRRLTAQSTASDTSMSISPMHPSC